MKAGRRRRPLTPLVLLATLQSMCWDVCRALHGAPCADRRATVFCRHCMIAQLLTLESEAARMTTLEEFVTQLTAPRT